LVAGMIRGNGLDETLKKSPHGRAVFAAFLQRQRELSIKDLQSALPDLVEAYARAYARIFTVDEMAEIGRFLITSAGQKFAVRSQQLMADPDVSAWQQKIAAREGQRQQAELSRFTTDFAAALKEDGQTPNKS
jgi:hypothetical protein